MKALRSSAAALGLALTFVTGLGATSALAAPHAIDGGDGTTILQEDPSASFEWLNGTPVLGADPGDGIITPFFEKYWDYSGQFKAALTSGNFKNTKAGNIQITVKPGNCTPGYGTIKFKLRVQETIGWSTVGTEKKPPCGTTSTYTYSSGANRTYVMVFERSGSVEKDENLKTVTGRVSYQ